MMLTIDEAKTLWCPFSRVASAIADGSKPLNVPAHNRAQGLDGPKIAGWGVPGASVCLADGCMAWRWRSEADLGFCGLAGRPE